MTDSTNNSSALNPVEQFDMYVAHVGINASNADEAEKIANLFTFHVNNIPAAEKYFAGRGFEIDESSRRLNPDGSTFLVYFKEEIAGFAIHLTMDK